MTTPLALVSFDLDGTLVDTAGEIAVAVDLTLAELGLPPVTAGHVRRRIGAGTRELLLALLRDLDAEPVDRDRALGCFERHYQATAGTRCRLYPHAMVAIDRLRRGGIGVACVTNKEMRFTSSVLAACGLGRGFDLVVGGDSLAVKKPDGAVLAHVCRALGVAPAAAAHVGDSRIDVEAARNAGVAAWAVPYGYSEGEPIVLAHPDRLFADLGEMADHVLSTGEGAAAE